MRYLLTILLLWTGIVYAQYPEQDDHTSIGGAGEWYNQSGHANMGVEGGTILCYNMGVNYTNSQQYIWESSDYGTQFVDDGLDSVYFAVNLTLDIRSNGDLFYMGYYDGGTWTDFLIPYRQVAVYTTFYVWAPKTTTKFRYRLFTGGSGTTNGKFVHIQFTKLDSPGNVLPVELLSWDAYSEGNNIILKWITASEINNDRFEVYWSPDGLHWKLIHTQKGAGNSSTSLTYYATHNTDSSENYYKLRQVDYDGRNEEFNMLYMYVKEIETKTKSYIYFNPLGQMGGLQLKKEIK